ncbi:2Fe-2S iron-sulfur cluster-binding protein [Nitrospirillum iridis]|uniref:2Fe-2S ferredoxin n=1 Tax=Nitrospirillum iridis TaxID=765888 RepID=A0A7X0EDY4_9PROT|nr:2Fe-2S iron-sulfur cluster-binding protein [Nitrospirillum iridis]MBB6253317.1 2Fe-2S ferredoxin [Nitrospirillum iridis]
MSALEVTFVEEDGTVRTVAADAGQTLMEAGKGNGVVGILADCGGSCACATCHVYVDADWLEAVGAPDDVEAEMLDMVSDVRRDTSRLACQIRLTDRLNGLRVAVAPYA